VDVGAIIPSPNDQEIVARLNEVFSPTGIKTLRDHQRRSGERLFDANHHLHRVAFRIGAIPTQARARGRWYALLRHLLPAATQNAIKRVLQSALDDARKNVDGVVFGVSHDPSAPNYFIYPDNADPFVEIPSASGSTTTYSLTLVTPGEIQGDGDSPDPPQPDPGEHAFRRRRRPPPKKGGSGRGGKRGASKSRKGGASKSAKSAKAGRKGARKSKR
jgi:hypothetical protein